MYLHRLGYLIERLANRQTAPGEITDAREIAVLRAINGGRKTKNDICHFVGGRRESVLGAVDRLVATGHVQGGSVAEGHKRASPYELTSTGAALLTPLQVVPESGSPLDTGTTGTTQHD
jgi:hypothetical protein